MRSFGGAGNASVGDGTGNGTVALPVGDGRLEHVDIIVPRAYQYSLNWSQARPTSVRTDRLVLTEIVCGSAACRPRVHSSGAQARQEDRMVCLRRAGWARGAELVHRVPSDA